MQIIKAHGCITDPSKIVLTRSQYFKARQLYSNFYKVLDALFLTHTLFFIGYGLNDPDIQLILENTNITFKSTHSHYSLIEAGMHETIKRSFQDSFNIKLIEYPRGLYEEANRILGELADAVVEKRFSNPAAV